MADTRLHPPPSMPTYAVRASVVHWSDELKGGENSPVEDKSVDSRASVRVSPASGTPACLGMPLAMYLDHALRPTRLGLLAKPIVVAEVRR